MKMVEKATEVGLSDVGTVFVRHFGGGPDDSGNPTREYFEVVAGAHHLAKRDTLPEAMAVAKALCIGAEREVPKAVVPEPEYVAPLRARVKGKFA